jgi:two-component system sensor histidine kinase ChvG
MEIDGPHGDAISRREPLQIPHDVAHADGALLDEGEPREEIGAVLVPSPEISELIRGLGRARSRIWVVDASHRVLAQAGALRPLPAAAEPEALSTWDRLASWVRPLTRPLLSEPREDFQDIEPGTYRLDWPEVDAALAGRETRHTRRTRDGRAEVVSAAAPVWVEDHVRGAVVVEETTNEILAGRNRGFEKLFAAILSVSLLGTTALFVFATRLSLRIRRLRDDVERAVDPRGRVTGTVRGTVAADEVGDLARSFAAILDQQRQYTSYLEQVGRRLSHEIRTPVGVVRSSLDNLSLGELPEQARVYIERAEEGLRRLGTILSRMSEASRLEQVLQASEREPFDLGRVVRGCVEGYRLANPGQAIELRVPLEPLLTLGAPDLIAQLLDKLVENALGFARPGTPILVSLARHGRMAALSISNSGPRLPVAMEGRLFESMVSVRPAGSGTSGEPHLGFGLYIARLIAQFHGGTAAAHDRPDGDGVIVTVTLPLQPEPGPPAA